MLVSDCPSMFVLESCSGYKPEVRAIRTTAGGGGTPETPHRCSRPRASSDYASATVYKNNRAVATVHFIIYKYAYQRARWSSVSRKSRPRRYYYDEKKTTDIRFVKIVIYTFYSITIYNNTRSSSL